MARRHRMMLKMFFIRDPYKRVEYLREQNIFHSLGENVMIMNRKLPLYANLISIGNNVFMATGVSFLTHDVAHAVLNNMNTGYEYQEKIGCIEIGDNVFIGSNVQITYDVKIGDNVIVAAGAVVAGDVPSNSVVGGVPAKVICTFEEFEKNRRNFSYDNKLPWPSVKVPDETEKEMWDKFNIQHNS